MDGATPRKATAIRSGWSIEERQLLHAYSAVLDMRTMVECSPQLGHTDASSKRCRQLTQRYRPGRLVGRSHGSPQDGQTSPEVDPLVVAHGRSPGGAGP